MAVAVSLPLGVGSQAKAACPPLPYTFTNGQTADAGQVIGDLNAIQVCIGNNGSVNSGTAGQVGAYSATGNAISGTSLSSVLDSSIGSTQGSVLFRNATGWVALAPGTLGQALVSGGPGSNPSWGSGGLPIPFYAALTRPSASAFTLVHATSTTATLGDMPSGRGMTMNVTGAGSNSNSSMEQPVLSQTAFTVTTTVFLASSLDGNWWVGLAAKDSTGKYDAFGVQHSGGPGTFTEFTFNSINLLNTTTELYGVFNPNGPVWLRLQLTGGNFIFSVSFDGENWETASTISATHFLGSTLSTVGVIVDDNSSHHLIVDDLSWSQTTP
ncbi:hypothetical protein [Phenylobacterium sp.]|uniref:hypothetical protein n=1 Tax=Phenylobacterium sp. TaxID=1871053 RepID=UPI0011F9A20F|nr:hypothetical protein [Phenylobacterium sp.]THD60771.1 MAG: hypothetical protein E8A49_13065 [Phenylobacterium sp.]